MKKIESSKKIVLFCDILLSLSVIITFIALFLNIEISSATQIITALVGLSAAGHSFYFWKARTENMRKYPDIMKLIENGAVTYNDFTNAGGV